MTMWHPGITGAVLGGVAWPQYSVVLLKPDCLRRGLADEVLARIRVAGEVIARETVAVQDWQIFRVRQRTNPRDGECGASQPRVVDEIIIYAGLRLRDRWHLAVRRLCGS